MSFGFITYGPYNLAAVAITGGWLPASCLAYRSGASTIEVDATNPLPVSLSSLPAITFASAQPVTQSGPWTVAVSSLPAVTISGTPSVSVSGTVAVTNSADATAETTRGTISTAVASILSGLSSLASETTLAAAKALLGAGLPASLGTGGGLKASLVDLGGAATDVVLAAVRDRLPATLGGNGGVKVDAAGATLPVSGSVSLSGTLPAFASTPAVSISGTPAVTASWATAQPVSLASLPAFASAPTVLLGAGSAAIGSVTVTSAPTTAVTNTNLDAALSTLAKESGGHLASIDTYAARIPAQGQALAAASMPVVLPSAQDLASLLVRLASGALRTQLDFGALSGSPWKVAVGTTMATAGIQIGNAGAATLRALWVENGTGGGIIMFLADRTSTLSNGSRSTHGYSSTIANAAAGPAMPSQLNIEGGLPFSNGIWLQASSTVSTMTGIASTTIQYVAVYSQGT